LIAEFCKWLEVTPASLYIQDHAWVVPSVQTVHILAISVVLATMAMLDLRMLGLAGRRHPVNSLAARFIPPVWVALVVLALTGAILIIGEPERELLNNAFRLKMLLVAAAAVILGFVQSTLKKGENFWSLTRGRQMLARVIGILSLSIWLVIAICGRWIAYVDQVQS
jgi:hypothetical protein